MVYLIAQFKDGTRKYLSRHRERYDTPTGDRQ
jgi:hypothetical protein